MNSSWKNIVPYILLKSAHQDVEIAKSSVPHPLKEGFTIQIGDPWGQLADYGLRVQSGKGIHVREYANTYIVHWDNVDPLSDPIGHLVQDAPHWIIIGALASFFALLTAACLLSKDSDNTVALIGSDKTRMSHELEPV